MTRKEIKKRLETTIPSVRLFAEKHFESPTANSSPMRNGSRKFAYHMIKNAQLNAKRTWTSDDVETGLEVAVELLQEHEINYWIPETD